MPHGPGLWTSAQIVVWKIFVDAVHAKECSMVCQLVAPGRAADAQSLEKEGYELLNSPAVTMPGTGFTEEIESTPVPREMSDDQIRGCIADFKTAARNPLQAATDGLEIHGANGYLVGQFTQDTCNKRTGSWGASITDQCRVAIEVARGCAQEIGAERISFRLSPWSSFQGMRTQSVEPTFEYLVTKLKEFDLAYLYIIESCVNNNVDCELAEDVEFCLRYGVLRS